MKLCEHRVRWFTLAAFLAGFAGVPQAYDDEMVQSHLQPFVGAYVGLYKPNTDDLQNMVPGDNKFSSVMPNGGLEMGVAYDRFHVGISVGYQPTSHGDLTAAEAVANTVSYPESFTNVRKDAITKNPSDSSTYVIVVSKWGNYPYYTNYSYDMLPIELFLDATVFKNSSAINFLIGGSVGISFVSLTLPYPVYTVLSGDTLRYFKGTNGSDHEALINTSGYLGARINLADRLNLEGQVGWRFAFTNEIYVNDMDANLLKNNQGVTLIQTNYGYYDKVKAAPATNQRLDLSGPYARVDLRWTFASQSEKEMDRTSSRREALQGAMMASAHRSR
jgi:hypothetical protein